MLGADIEFMKIVKSIGERVDEIHIGASEIIMFDVEFLIVDRNALFEAAHTVRNILECD